MRLQMIFNMYKEDLSLNNPQLNQTNAKAIPLEKKNGIVSNISLGE